MNLCTIKLSPPTPSCGFGCCPLLGGDSVVVDTKIIVAPSVYGVGVFGPWLAVQYLVAIISLGKMLVALCLSPWCHGLVCCVLL